MSDKEQMIQEENLTTVICQMISDGADQGALREQIDQLLEREAARQPVPAACARRLRQVLEETERQLSLSFPALGDFLPASFADPGTGDTTFLTRNCRERLLRLARIFPLTRLPENDKAREMCRYILSHVDEDISLQQMAQQFYMNEKYLSGFFHRQTGLSFRDFCTRVRIERARKLLSDGDRKVYEVAALLHFRDVEYFSRVFRRCTGMTPSTYVWSPEDDLYPTVSPAKRAAAAPDREIRVGILGNYSGIYAYLDGGKRELYTLAAEEINESGGICGRRVRLIFVDFASDLSLVEQRTREVIDSGVDLLIGGFLSSAREIIRKVVDERKVLYFYDSLYEGGLADHYTFCFASMPEQNLQPVIEYLLRQGRRRFYILATDYNYGILSCEYARYLIRERGGEVTAVEYIPLQKENFSLTIENIAELRPDALVTFLVGERQNRFFEQLHDSPCHAIPVISTSAIPQEHLHLRARRGILENLFFCAAYTQELSIPASTAWKKKLRERCDLSRIPYLGSDQEAAYITLLFYRAAIERCHSTDTEDVIHALESGLSLETSGGPTAINSADHHLIRQIGVYRVDENNQIHLLELLPQVKSTFVEDLLHQQYQVRGGLRELGLRSPNLQYNLMFYRI